MIHDNQLYLDEVGECMKVRMKLKRIQLQEQNLVNQPKEREPGKLNCNLLSVHYLSNRSDLL